MSANQIQDNKNEPQSEIQYVDLDDLEYEEGVLLFLRKKLDSFAIDCFREVKDNHRGEGLHKTKAKNYLKNRKRYDAALLTLEAQGFIEQRRAGKGRPYFLTVRGFQLALLLSKEKDNEKIERL